MTDGLGARDGFHPGAESIAWPDVQRATAVALGKAKFAYSATVYVVGLISGVWGVPCSDDGRATGTRFNDDAHQLGGIGLIAAYRNLYRRLSVAGNGRGFCTATEAA